MDRFGLQNWSSPNWLKFGTVYCYTLISNLMFIFPKIFVICIFLWQLWSQNLMFSKLIEIWCRFTLLYAYYDLSGVFFKKICQSYFLGKFDIITWISSNWLKFRRGYIAIISLLQFWYLFFQNYFDSYFFGKFGPKTWSSTNKLKFDTELHCYMFVTILMFSFSKFCYSYNFGQILAKSNVLHIDWNLMQGHIVTWWLWSWSVIFRSIYHS